MMVKLAAVSSFFAALFSIAIGFGYLVGGSPGIGLLVWVFATPTLFGLSVVFDWVKYQLQKELAADKGIIDIEPERIFTKFGGGG